MAGKFLKKKSAKKGSGVLLAVLSVVFAACVVFSCVKIVQTSKERALGVEVYASLAQSVVMPQTAAPTHVETQITQQETEPNKQTPVVDLSVPPEVDFEALSAINPQVVGWISSDDGAIHYPVVQGTDNDYYLNHLVDGTVNSNGSVFMDFRSAADLSDRNTFIYGHNMRNGAMFATLPLYAEPGYYENHPELLLMTREGCFSLQVFAGCVVPGNSDLYQLSYRDDAAFASYIERVQSLSDFASDVSVSQGDKVVTLSTCAYHYEDARYLLFCKVVPMR